ncbi:MAG: 4Fe-4S dicluster domain-containing protein [Chloroflexi bacterium]|nr:4Fe-4S dicluster domain-containing protein [Chloroflexota bacterium]MCL5075236.1 4Fe-4S dicluster domain-containing protein [Chloroflexota bacterium]
MKIEDKLYLDRFKPDEQSHLIIIDQEKCRTTCVAQNRPCTHFCPAQVYKWEEDKITVAFEGCLECGACRIGCPFSNIDWRYPRGGFGVQYKFG